MKRQTLPFILLLVAIFLSAAAMSIAIAASPKSFAFGEWFADWLVHLGTAFFSAALIGALIILLEDVELPILEFQGLLHRPAEKTAGRAGNQKVELLRILASGDPQAAKEALKKIQAEDWHTDGSLRGINLEGANLREIAFSNANLEEANLSRAILAYGEVWRTNLSRAYLRGANLSEARIWETLLEDATLRECKMQGTTFYRVEMPNANLIDADLRAAEFWGVNLSQAFLDGADLRNATFWNVTFDEGTTLPDGSNWTPETDFTRFTNPEHPNAWKPEQISIPARK